MEKVAVRDITDSVGTPCYIYSYSSIENNFNSYSDSLSELNPDRDWGFFVEIYCDTVYCMELIYGFDIKK